MVYSNDVTPALFITDSLFSGNEGGGTADGGNTTVCVQAYTLKGVPKLTGVLGVTPTTAPFPSISGHCLEYMTQA